MCSSDLLERFGLNDITDLPKVDDLSDALGFELPAGLAEATETTSPLPFDSPAEAVAQPSEPASEASPASKDTPESVEDPETVH